MDLNATLLGQMITFIVFIAITMRFIWPPILKALRERQQKITEGLAAAERGVHELELAHHKVLELLRDAKIQAADILDQANKRAARIIDESKDRAREEGDRLIKVAKAEIEQELFTARQALQKQVALLAIDGAEKILQQKIDHQLDEHLLKHFVSEMNAEMN